MAGIHNIHFGGDPIHVENLPGIGVTRAMGKTVPTDGTAGYAPSCLFQHYDGGDGTALYVNEGTNTSCDFNAVLVA